MTICNNHTTVPQKEKASNKDDQTYQKSIKQEMTPPQLKHASKRTKGGDNNIHEWMQNGDDYSTRQKNRINATNVTLHLTGQTL